MKPAPSSLRRFYKPDAASSGATQRGHGRTAIVLPGYHQAVRGGRTLFPSRVFAATEVGRVLKDGHQSRKIGRFVAKGHRRGWPIYTLTLEERATCPRSCREWQGCYGNHMQAAERIDAGIQLNDTLRREVADLARLHPAGFLVRLHVLGDFPDALYVALWAELLDAHPALHLFGFTAHQRDTAIGALVFHLIDRFGWARVAIRVSGARGADFASRVLGPGDRDREAIACPAQTGATDCCATCALCWQSTRSIAFKRH